MAPTADTSVPQASEEPADPIAAAIAAGDQDETSLTDQEFARRHPELEGAKIGPNDRDLAEEWVHIRDQVVRPALVRFYDEAASTCPAQLRLVKGVGYEGSGGGNVAEVLARLRSEKGLSISDADIDMLMRIAEVESSGHLTSINTWDSAVLSAGFMQWTLRYGELTAWIQSAAEAFARHGIAVDEAEYCIGQDRCAAIKGAASSQELRQLPWAVRFACATVDPDVVVAQVRMALDTELPRQRRAMEVYVNQHLADGWSRIADYYERSSLVRALLHEAYNNRPAYARAAALAAAQALDASLSDDDFVTLLIKSIINAYASSGEPGATDKAQRLTAKVQAPAPYCTPGT